MKTEPIPGVTANLTLFNTDIRDYQAQVVNAASACCAGILRTPSACACGASNSTAPPRSPADCHSTARSRSPTGLVSFPDAPPPSRKPAGRKPRTSRVPISRASPGLGLIGRRRIRQPGSHSWPLGPAVPGIDADATARRSRRAPPRHAISWWPVTPLVNARVGFKLVNGWMFSVWSRNLFDQDYLKLLSAAPGGSGLYVGLPGEPRTVGVTLRMGLGNQP